MELKEWELRELERIRQERKDLETLYFEAVKRNEKKEILENMQQQGEDPERVAIIEELFNHRYISKGKDIENIDHAIRGWVNIRFLMEMSKGLFSKKKVPKKVEEILDDLGKNVCEKHGELGRELWEKEAENIVRVYIHLCQTDKSYSSVLFGIGHMKKEKLERKICYDVVDTTHTIPAMLGIDKFKDLEAAAVRAFKEMYPKSGNLIEAMTDKADGKKTYLDDTEE